MQSLIQYQFTSQVSSKSKFWLVASCPSSCTSLHLKSHPNLNSGWQPAVLFLYQFTSQVSSKSKFCPVALILYKFTYHVLFKSKISLYTSDQSMRVIEISLKSEIVCLLIDRCLCLLFFDLVKGQILSCPTTLLWVHNRK